MRSRIFCIISVVLFSGCSTYSIPEGPVLSEQCRLILDQESVPPTDELWNCTELCLNVGCEFEDRGIVGVPQNHLIIEEGRESRMLTLLNENELEMGNRRFSATVFYGQENFSMYAGAFTKPYPYANSLIEVFHVSGPLECGQGKVVTLQVKTYSDSSGLDYRISNMESNDLLCNSPGFEVGNLEFLVPDK